MATVAPVPTEVRPLDGCLTRTGTAGEAMTVGSVVQIVGDGEWEMANATTADGVAGVLGIVVSGSLNDKDGDIASGETISVVIHGGVYLGSTVTLDETKMYFPWTTDGILSDVAPANFRSFGYPLNATCIFVNPITSPAGS